MTVHTFQSVTRSATRSGKCPCGKRVKNSTTFEQTINPFNKNAKGQVKSYSEIWAEITEDAKLWEARAPHHSRRSRSELTDDQRAQLDNDGIATLTCGVQLPLGEIS